MHRRIGRIARHPYLEIMLRRLYQFGTIRKPIEQREYCKQCGAARLVFCRIRAATVTQINLTEIDLAHPASQAQDNTNAPMATRRRFAAETSTDMNIGGWANEVKRPVDSGFLRVTRGNS
eukprot:2676754-Heterocapsa_arctica.AAC.1